jgi:DNA repair protein REV1
MKGMMPKTANNNNNLKRITRQLAPRNRPVMLSPKKNRLFAKREEFQAVQVSEAQLRRLDIDPEVFALLPEDVQREQLTMARQAKAQGVPPSKLAERKVLKAWKPRARPVYRLPPPQARYIQPPFLKQKGKEKGSKLYFTETSDVQRAIGEWVEGFREHPPNARDVDFFAKFLLESVDGEKSSDVGIEKAVMVMKWWLVLLRRYWGVWETDDEEAEVRAGDDRVTSEMIGKTWWRAFRSVKEKMDVAVRKKFGGQLSLR